MKLHEYKVAVITGGNSGIGLATAKELAKEGAKIVIADYNEKTQEGAVEAIREAAPGAEVMAVTVNVAKEVEVKAMVEKTVERFGRLDYLFNNAGIDGEQKPIIAYDAEVFQRVLDINVNGVFYGMKYAMPVMQKQGGGAIVNTSSALGLCGSNYMSAYVAAKHAVVGLTKVGAIEGGPAIRVNSVNPGGVRTPMVDEAFRNINPENPEAAMKAFTQRNPLQRFCLPEEIAAVVSFLLSDKASYINGQSIALDGGEMNKYGM